MLTKCFESGLVGSAFTAEKAYKDPENLLKTLRAKLPVLLSLLTQRGVLLPGNETSTAFADFHSRKTLDKTREGSKHQPHLKAGTG